MADDVGSDSEQSFHSIHSRPGSPRPSAPVTTDGERFSPDEEARLLSESATLKASGNKLFGSGSYSEAISVYDRALASVPSYLDYETAVLHANIAACHLKLSEWDEAIASASKALDALERLDPVPPPVKDKKVAKDTVQLGKRSDEEPPIDETTQAQKDAAGAKLQAAKAEAATRLATSGHPLSAVRTLRTKSLLRRAQARTHLSSWSALQGADEDYKQILSSPGVGETERRSAQSALAALGPRLDAARKAEMDEMLGKLKGLGNSILKPFGLSTNNFKFEPDGKGGYGMRFEQ